MVIANEISSNNPILTCCWTVAHIYQSDPWLCILLSCGGIELRALHDQLICRETIEKRLDQAFNDLLPLIQECLWSNRAHETEQFIRDVSAGTIKYRTAKKSQTFQAEQKIETEQKIDFEHTEYDDIKSAKD